MTDKHTSLALSKLLKENGCKLLTKALWTPIFNGEFPCILDEEEDSLILKDEELRAYDILWDICIKYKIEFFGDDYIDCVFNPKIAWHYYPVMILTMLQQNKSQKEIEEYIWDNCKFNKNNKVKDE